MKKVIVLCLLFLSVDGIAQDMDVVKYGYFSNPLFPIMSYQNLGVNKIPSEIEEVTYSYNSTNKKWEKKEELSYYLNPNGFLDYLTKTSYTADIVIDSYKKNYHYTSNGPSKIVLTRDKEYMSQANLVKELEYVINNGELASIIIDKDTINAKADPLKGKDHIIESVDYSGYYKLIYTSKLLGLTMHKHHYFSSSQDAKALFHLEEKYKTIDIYLPNDRTFFFNKYSEFPASDIESLTNALSTNIQAYEELLIKPNYFNGNNVQGVGHLTFKDGVNGNWVAIFNKKSTYYSAPTITMRKIIFPDKSIEGTIILDESLSSKVK